MNKIKIVFFDVDGTLISFKTHKIPESTKKSLYSLREKGIKLFIATGRSPFALSEVKHLLDFEFDGYITLNGQYCIVDNKIIRDTPLPEESLQQILPYIEKNKIACEVLELDYVYSNLVNERVIELKKLLGRTDSFSPIEDIKRIEKNPTYQLCAFIKDCEEEEFFKNMPNCRGVRWNPFFVDVIPEEGGKRKGLEAVLDYFGFSKDEAMAFGDGGNDIEMIEFVKYGVAMGNSGEDVKKAAMYVTDDIDNEGVYSALTHFGILK